TPGRSVARPGPRGPGGQGPEIAGDVPLASRDIVVRTASPNDHTVRQATGQPPTETPALRIRRPRGALLAIGVDAGGTTVRVEAWRGGRRARRAELAAVEVAALPALLRRLWRGWRLSPARVGALVVASRGIWTAAERRRLEGSVRGLARRVRAISDAQAAYLGALGGGAGLLVLAGTGSIVIGRRPTGSWNRAGGLGPLLGDEGSAFWIGREWLRARTGGGHARARARALDGARRAAGPCRCPPGPSSARRAPCLTACSSSRSARKSRAWCGCPSPGAGGRSAWTPPASSPRSARSSSRAGSR